MKLFEIKKAFGPHQAGDVIEFDEASPAVLALVEAGMLAEAPAATEDVLSKALASVSAAVATAIEKGTAAAKGIPAGHIEAGESEADRKKSFGSWLQLIGVAGSVNHDIRERETARGVIEKMYGSRFNSNFDADWKRGAEATGVAKAALAEGSGTTGGYTVPPEYATRLLEFPPEEVVLVGKTDEYPMVGRELIMPVLDQTTATGTAGYTSYFGGVVAKWTAEAALRPETEPAFKDLRLVANELSGYALASRNVLMDNVVALEQRLSTLFRNAIAWYRDYAYLQGDGIGKPKGVLNSGALLTSTRNTASHIKFADLASMVSKLMPGSFSRATWILSPTAYGELIGLVDGASRPIFQPIAAPGAGAAAASIPLGILGRPYAVTEKLPALGTSGDILLVDPKQYFSATRQDVEIAASEHYKFLNNQVAFRFLFRGDGTSWMDKPFTTQDQSTQLSPFVALT